MYSSKLNIGNIEGQLESALEKSGGLRIPMRFVGFKFDGVPEDKITVDIRGKSVTDITTGKTKFISWQTGVALVAHENVDVRNGPAAVVAAIKFYRWILEPGRLQNLRRDAAGVPFPFAGITLDNGVGFSPPAIMPAERVRMYCPSGCDAFFDWDVCVEKSRRIDKRETLKESNVKGYKRPQQHDDLPRLKCLRCGCKLNTQHLSAQKLLGEGKAREDAGYTSADHADIQGFAEAYHSEEPVIGAKHLFPRLWAVYDAHRKPGIWQAEDAMAFEVQKRFSDKGKTIRPLSMMVSSGGRPKPTSFVMEASPKMRYAWLTDAEIREISQNGLDYRKSLVPRSACIEHRSGYDPTV